MCGNVMATQRRLLAGELPEIVCGVAGLRSSAVRSRRQRTSSRPSARTIPRSPGRAAAEAAVGAVAVATLEAEVAPATDKAAAAVAAAVEAEAAARPRPPVTTREGLRRLSSRHPSWWLS